MTRATRVLSIHAGYTCGHSGRCCTSGWPIPIEAAALSQVRARLADGTLATAHDTPPFVHHADGALVGTTGRRCAFHDDQEDGHCRIHRVCGHDGLPVACQQFPRQVVLDPRGVSITLSHVCPTADRRAQAQTQPLSITINDPAFPLDTHYSGLDAEQALPPALRPDWLLDWPTWWALEAQAIDWLATDPLLALPRLRCLLKALAHTPPNNTADLAARTSAIEQLSLTPWVFDPQQAPAIATALLDAVPEPWREDARQALGPTEATIGVADWTRVVAAHTFASWPAYAGATVWTWLVAVEDVARVFESVGAADQVDLVVRHLADSSALIAHWNREATRRYSSAMNGYL